MEYGFFSHYRWNIKKDAWVCINCDNVLDKCKCKCDCCNDDACEDLPEYEEKQFPKRKHLICFTQQELNDLISDTTKFAWQQVQLHSNNTNMKTYPPYKDGLIKILTEK